MGAAGRGGAVNVGKMWARPAMSDRVDTVPSMLWTEDAPTHCPNGHRLGPGRVLVGWMAPRAGTLEQGYRTHECRECGAVTKWEPTCSWK